MIYFVRAEVAGLIKIGFTRGDPAARMAELQVGSPVRLTLIGAIPGDRADERRHHQQFAHAHSHGEWFFPCPDLLAYIDANVPKPAEEADPMWDFWVRANRAAATRHRHAFNTWKSRFYDTFDGLETDMQRLPGCVDEGDERWERAWESFRQAKEHMMDIPVLGE